MLLQRDSRTILGRDRLLVGIYVALAAYTAVYAVTTELTTHRVWGVCAVAGYLAAGAVLLRSRNRPRAAGVAVLGAVLVPMIVLIGCALAQLEVAVVVDSARHLLDTGSPYVNDPHELPQYNPYLPAMALFGLPGVVIEGPLGDPRVWFGVFFVACVVTVVRLTVSGLGRIDKELFGKLGLLAASPLVAIPLCTGGVDLPVIGACLLGLGLMAADRRWAGAVVLAFACALKWTAWPVAVVALVLHHQRAGMRSTVSVGALAVALASVMILPSAILDGGNIIEHTVLFPLGRADVPTPAGSSVIGGALAAASEYGHIVSLFALLVGAVVIGVRLCAKPPSTFVAACSIAALGLTVLFLLAPSARFGYFAYPLMFWGMAWIARGARTDTAVSSPSRERERVEA
ncbi:glycosyltransferase 87 family protein [Rhodococcus sp. H29-C3]|uniref:glycosyltransferase 87 family protein n=1 Tax=Rhodococcus sp. H29-C3 TaxID=3046307 RepID=UPI0024B951FE|nr:glycosyltransferase 87 family protein [Rhodococcus sp. H29-C3]MDJ0363103.1 glycosyltransferase 87 family protein [Rhodococcus sp. H29-C3]